MTTRQISLCLACSSSPSPKAWLSPSFSTPCCARPICERCLASNPRLRGYNPCLACLAGVAVVEHSRKLNGKTSVNVKVPGPSGQSVDQEQSMFVLGDSDDEDSSPTADADFQDMPPPYTGALDTSSTVAVDETSVGETVDETADAKGSNPSKYYVQPGDTLRGIALRHGVDGHKICQLNSLPFSVLSTTPHLLHTRRWLNLPPTGLSLPPPDPKVLEAHNRERAEKRFQFVTKEVDWRVAKAYVALAEDDNGSYKSMESLQEIRKHSSERHGPEARAVDQYLNDEEWEAGQSGRPRPKEFPFFAVHDEENGKAMTSSRLGRLIWH